MIHKTDITLIHNVWLDPIIGKITIGKINAAIMPVTIIVAT